MKAYSYSKTPKEVRDRRGTPWPVFRRIEELLGITFYWDVCADKENTKVKHGFWTEEDDALSLDWGALHDREEEAALLPVVFMNPPYSDPLPWCRVAAIKSVANKIIVVGLLPDDRSTEWYKGFVWKKATVCYVPDKRISFIDPITGQPQAGNPKGSIVTVWTPWRTGHTDFCHFDL